MGKIIKFSNIFIVMFLPIAAFCLSLNLAVRMPDIYQYVFKSTEQLADAGLYVSDDEVGAIISDFMIGKNVDWNIKAGEDVDQKYPIFNEADINYLKDIRLKLNIALAVGVLSLLIFVFVVLTLRDSDDGKIVRKNLEKSVGLFTIILLALVAFFIFSKFSGFASWNDWLDKMVVSEAFYKVFSLSLLKYLYIAWLLASAVFMLISFYAVSKLTVPKRIFSRGNY